jgi:hypothetical protein
MSYYYYYHLLLLLVVGQDGDGVDYQHDAPGRRSKTKIHFFSSHAIFQEMNIR